MTFKPGDRHKPETIEKMRVAATERQAREGQTGPRAMRRWVRAWWADQMRNPTVPAVPEDFESDAFYEIWASEGRRCADIITAKDRSHDH